MKRFTGFLEVADNADKFFGNVRKSNKIMFAFRTFLFVVIFENGTPNANILSRNEESIAQISRAAFIHFGIGRKKLPD